MRKIKTKFSTRTFFNMISQFFLILLIFFALNNAYASRLACPTIKEKDKFQDLVEEVIERELNGYRVLECSNTKQFYKYLSNQDLKFEDSERTIDSKKIIRIKKSDTQFKIHRINSSDIGEIHITYSIQTKVKGKLVKFSDLMVIMLAPSDAPEYESCADVVSFPKNFIVYDNCK